MDIRKNLFTEWQALAQAPQGGGGITVTEGVTEPCGCSTEEHG